MSRSWCTSKPERKPQCEEIIVRTPVNSKPSIDVELQIVVAQAGPATIEIVGRTATKIRKHQPDVTLLNTLGQATANADYSSVKIGTTITYSLD